MRHAMLALCAAVAVAVAGVGAATAHAQAGTPDPGFGTAGVAQTPFGSGARAAAVALGPAGTLAVAGDVRGSGGEGTLVARFTAAGALDTTFDAGGFRLDRFGAGAPAPQRGRAVVVTPTGATVVAGVAGDRIMVARYLPDGALDGLFGAGGIVLRDLSGGAGMPEGAGLAAVALTATGQMLVAGSVGVPAGGDPYEDDEPGEQVVVGRLSDRGVPDPAFGDAGFALLQLGARSARRPARSRAGALALAPDGRVVIAGEASGTDGAKRAVVARVTAAGRLDTSFARRGRKLVQFGLRSAAGAASSALHALLRDPDGSVLAAGASSDVAGGSQALLARFTVAGALDPRFGRGGFVTGQLGTGRDPRSVVRALAPAAEGTLLAGSADAGGALTARVGPTGRLDCAYGARRTAVTGSNAGDPAFDGVFGIAVQPDGALAIAGRAPGGGVLLQRRLGGQGSVPAPAALPRLRTLAPRYTGRGRAFAYGVVDVGCGAAVKMRFVATPPRRGGRTVRSRVTRVGGAHGRQVVCAALHGLTAGREYRVRIESRPPRAAAGAPRVLRAVATGREPRAQDGCP